MNGLDRGTTYPETKKKSIVMTILKTHGLIRKQQLSQFFMLCHSQDMKNRNEKMWKKFINFGQFKTQQDTYFSCFSNMLLIALYVSMWKWNFGNFQYQHNQPNKK
jgi:hypothetical protein